MLVWILVTLLVVILSCPLLSSLSYSKIREVYPKSILYNKHEFGKRDLIPKNEKLKYLLKQDTLIACIAFVMAVFAVYYLIGWAIDF